MYIQSFLSYVLSYVYLAILQVTKAINCMEVYYKMNNTLTFVET